LRKLFGTDGIRGVAGVYPLDKKTIHSVGRALGHHLPAGPKRIVVGQDTRESSDWIAETLAAGLHGSGAETESAGVIPTPGIAYLVHSKKFSAGVVISASHNSWEDNGIKIFSPAGYKLPDETELEIEREIFSLLAGETHSTTSLSTLVASSQLHNAYVQWLARPFPGAGRLKVVVDLANGAASNIAPEVFRLCGLNAEFIHNSPNGRNINKNCGALHPDVVAKEVVAHKADLGICFDGDADRALFADHRGMVVNGDAVMLLLARQLKQRGELANDTLVATTMSNMGLEIALKELGIRMLRAPVGDKYVLDEMEKSGAVIGGEQSGHIILAREATTGDGLLTSLRVLAIVAGSGRPLAELVAGLKVFPQVIKNVRVREKEPLSLIPAIWTRIEEAERDLNGSGRVVVRYSGTEALARVMIEAESKEKMERHANAIAEAIQTELGERLVNGQ
jgi:phosphoglucosamine mutase